MKTPGVSLVLLSGWVTAFGAVPMPAIYSPVDGGSGDPGAINGPRANRSPSPPLPSSLPSWLIPEHTSALPA